MAVLDIEKYLYDDLDKKKQFPNVNPYVLHYTSLEVAEKILSNKEIWLSNPLFMNDHHELAFGIVEAENFIRSAQFIEAVENDELYSSFSKCFINQRVNFENEHALNIYVGCFCEEDADSTDGLLSMWRGYAQSGKGVALALDFSKIPIDVGSSLIFAPVEYDTNENRIEYLRKRIVGFINIVKSEYHDDLNLEWATLILFRRIILYSIFSKHIGFREESEWRVVYLPWNDEQKKLKKYFSYLIGSRGVEPKLKLPIEPISGFTHKRFNVENVIDKVILGPNGSSILVRASFVQMLRLLNLNKIANRVFCFNNSVSKPKLEIRVMLAAHKTASEGIVASVDYSRPNSVLSSLRNCDAIFGTHASRHRPSELAG